MSDTGVPDLIGLYFSEPLRKWPDLQSASRLSKPLFHLIKILKNIIAILSPAERRKSVVLVISDAIISMLDIASLVLLLLIINFYTLPLVPSHLIFLPDTLLNRNSILLIGLFGVAFCIKNALAYQLHRSQYQFVYSVASRLSENNLLHYLEGSYSEQVSVDSSVYIRQISHQPIEFSHYVLAGVQQIITQSFLISLAVTAILVFNAKLFLLLLILLLPPVAGVAIIIKKRSKAVRKYSRHSSEKTLQHLKEALAGFIESNIDNKTYYLTDRYSRYQRQLNHLLADIQVVQGIPSRLMEVFAVAGLFILILINKWGGNESPVGILTIGMFMAAAYKIIPGVVKILNCSGQIRTYDYTLRDLLNKTKRSAHQAKKLNKVNISSIEFDKLSFSYDKNKLINDLSCSFKKGEMIGITGNSGKGKTSLINLLLGFIAPDSGRILINGESVATGELSQYWPDIAYVKQEPFLIHDTILMNITLEENSSNPEKLERVIRASGLDTLINSYREGVNRVVAENGKDISGGQRQRIVIARALYKDAHLIILDEPFNELERNAEDNLLQYFKQLAREGKIILLITHNATSLSFCSKTISLNEA